MSSYITLRESCSTGKYANVFYAYPDQLNFHKYYTENFIIPGGYNNKSCENNKCLVRNPKSGSSAMNLELPAKNIEIIGAHYTTLNKPNEIVVIRDPVERFKSAVNYMRYVGHRYKTEYLLKFDSFVNMMKVTDLNKLYDKVLTKDLVFTPQYYWISDKGAILCYENGLENEFKDKIGIDVEFPQVNTKDNLNTLGGKSPTEEEREKYWKDSDEIVKIVVNHFYKKDIELYKKYCG